MRMTIYATLLVVACLVSTCFAGDTPDDTLWYAVCMQETGANPNPPQTEPGSVGIAQIRAGVVADCNRILARSGRGERFTLKDRSDPDKARAMFNIYLEHYGGVDATYEKLARIWNGGPRGYLKDATVKYWEGVKRFMPDPETSNTTRKGAPGTVTTYKPACKWRGGK